MRARFVNSGFMLGLRALVAKELRSRSRGWRSMWILTTYLGLLTAVVCGFIALASQVGGTVSTGLGTWLFSSLALGSLILLAFVTPAFTAGAISGERERRTLDLLLITRASPLGVVVGKLVGSQAYVVLLVVASLPGFALVYLFGGVPVHYLVMVFAVLLTTSIAHSALALFLSALLKRTVLATVAAYFLVLGLVLGIPFVSVAVGIASAVNQAGSGVSPFYPYGGPNAGQTPPSPPRRVLLPPSAYAMVSPITSMTSVLPGEAGTSGLGMMARMSGFGIMGNLTVPRPGPVWESSYVSAGEEVVAFAPWVYHFAFSWVLSILCLLLASVAVSPVKPWRALAARRRPAKLLATREAPV